MGNSPSQQHQHQNHQHSSHQSQSNTSNATRHHLAFQNQFRASPLSPSAGIGPGPGHGPGPGSGQGAPSPSSESQDYFSHQPQPHAHAHGTQHGHQVPQRLPQPARLNFKSQPIAINPRSSNPTSTTSTTAMAASPGNHATANATSPAHARASLEQPFVGSPLSYASSIVTQHPGMTADDTALAELPENTHQLPVADDPLVASAPPMSPTSPPPMSPTSLAAAAGNAPSALTAALRASAVPPSPTKESPAPTSSSSASTAASSVATLPPPSPMRAPAAVPASMLVPTTIAYTHPTSASSSSTSSPTSSPSAVFITGTFNAWRSKIPLRLQPPASPTSPTTATATFAVTLALAPGIYRFKFIVDDEWRCAPKLPTAQDEDGNLVNFVEVTAAASATPSPSTDAPRSRAATTPAAAANDAMHSTARAVPAGGSHPAASAVPSHVRGPTAPAISASVPTSTSTRAPAAGLGLPPSTPLSESPPGSYSSHVPTSQSLINLATLALHPSSSSSPAPPPTGTFSVTQGPDGSPVLDPPALPAHLTKVVLNQVKAEDQSLPVPPHVALNHLYACSIKDGVMAVAVTGRYRKKCVTTVVYRPVNI